MIKSPPRAAAHPVPPGAAGAGLKNMADKIKYIRARETAVAWSTDTRPCSPRRVQVICEQRGTQFGAKWVGWSDPLPNGRSKRQGIWLIPEGIADQRKKAGRPRKKQDTN
jgi:hypothetical protein